MSSYKIDLYTSKRGFSLVAKVNKQPAVVFNELTLDEAIKFIKHFEELIVVTAMVNKSTYEELEKRLMSSNVCLEFRVGSLN
jgi:hypothetical protein